MARTIMPSKTLTATHGEQGSWQLAIYSATPVSVLILGLFYYWFGVANRYDIFLYGHTTKGIPITQPFDVLTSSRYWMAGLVGSGIVMLCLMLIHAVKLPGQGLSISQTAAFIYAAGGTLGSAVWLAIMTGLRKWRQRPQMNARALLAAGLCFTYLLLPLTHYVFATPIDHRYISAASNFFASSPALQGLTFVVAAGLAGGFSLLRKRLW